MWLFGGCGDEAQSDLLFLTVVNRITKMEDGTCVVCADEDAEYFAVGGCGHAYVCSTCAVRQRAKLRQFDCVVCRERNEIVFIVQTRERKRTFEDLKRRYLPYGDRPDPTRMRFLEDARAYVDVKEFERIESMNAFRCPVARADEERCEGAMDFRSLKILQNHMTRVHGVRYCEVCVQGRKQLFLSEHVPIPLAKMKAHQEAHHFRCPFQCEKTTRFLYDRDALLKHLSDAHIYCDVCLRSARRSIFFRSEKDLAQHERSTHYHCRYCPNIRFIVFATLDSLRKHVRDAHPDKPLPSSIHIGDMASSTCAAERADGVRRFYVFEEGNRYTLRHDDHIMSSKKKKMKRKRQSTTHSKSSVPLPKQIAKLNDEDEIADMKQNKGRGAKRSGTARSSHIAWMQKRQSQIAKKRQRLNMRLKQLRRKLSATGVTPSQRAGIYCSLAEFMRSAEMDDEELNAWTNALDADPTSARARRGLVSALMNAADAASARELCERFESDGSAAFAWCRALLEHLSFHVLGESGATEKAAKRALRKAHRSNPFVSLLIGRSQTFFDIVGGDTLDVLLSERRRKRHGKEDEPEASEAERDIAEAFEYCLSGVSCWLDAPGGPEKIDEVVLGENLNDIVRRLHKTCVDAVREAEAAGRTEDVPCVRLFLRFVERFGTNAKPTKDDESADASVVERTDSKKKQKIARSDSKTMSKSARRRKRAGYSRSVNRKKQVYGGHSNDICVYVD
eukprot:g1692.t1